MEHRATALCSLLGRHWRLQETSAGLAEWSTGLTGQCSLQGRQECLPYLAVVKGRPGG